MPTVSVKTIAAGISRSGDKPQDVINRVRNWTKEGLIVPVGDKAPGTGRSLQYPMTAIATARGLSVLADVIGMPASRSRSMGRFLANAKGIFAGKTEKRFLIVGFDDGEGRDFALLENADEVARELATAVRPAHIVVDLHAYFDGLKGEKA